MGEKKIVALLMFIVAYGLAVTPLSYSQNPPACNKDDTDFLSYCGNYFKSVVPNPSSDCCKTASVAFKKAMANGQGIRDICNCIRGAQPISQFPQPKLLSLPDACKIQLTFNMHLCVYGGIFPAIPNSD